MAISYTNIVGNPFETRALSYRRIFPIIGGCLGSEAPYGKSLSIKTDQDTIEIPCLLINSTMKLLRRSILNKTSLSEIIMPVIFRKKSIIRYKTAQPVLKAIFYNTEREAFCDKLTCSTDTYYGGFGTIFYKDRSPMLLETITLKKNHEDGKEAFSVLKQTAYISPKVFLSEDILSKHIRGRFIKELMSLNANKYTFGIGSSDISGNDFAADITVVVEDLENKFVTPKIPTTMDSTETISKFLIDNCDIVLQGL